MKYDFKILHEIVWAIVIAAAIAAATIAVDFEPGKIVNWQTWAIAAAGSVARASAVAVLVVMRRVANSSEWR